MGLLIFAILLIVVLIILVRCIVIVPQSNAYVTEWLGVYKDTWAPACTSAPPLWSVSPARSPSRRKRRIFRPSLSSPVTTSP